MKAYLWVVLFFAIVSYASEKTEKHVKIDPNAPKIWVPDEYISFQTPPTPEPDTQNLFVTYNEKRNQALARKDRMINLGITALCAGTVASAALTVGYEDSDLPAKTLRRATLVWSIFTCIAQSFKTCRDCRRKRPKEFTYYSQGTTPRNLYPATASSGATPESHTRTLA